jgi:hypothetical protein
VEGVDEMSEPRLDKELLTAFTITDLKEWYERLDELGVRHRTGKTSENRDGVRMRTFTVYTDSDGLCLFDTNYVTPNNPIQCEKLKYGHLQWDAWGPECYQMMIGKGRIE